MADEKAEIVGPGPIDGESPTAVGTKSDEVYELLRHQILVGQIRPGERINVRALESVLGMSHIPIREAIPRLETDGLVKRQANVGAIATRVSIDEFDEIYDFRRIIEPALARRAVPLMTDDDTVGVRKALERLEATGHSTADSDDFHKTHQEFHRRILKPGISVRIERTLNELWRVSERYLRLLDTPVRQIGHHQHEAMALACVERDAERVEELLADHLEVTSQAMRTVFSNDDYWFHANTPATVGD